ncbi:DoxX family membrane protein [Candidatus Sumerlaeota bacterium]|nr:DoxX family membrane protein [Candidatus Sumerlaeota bacterium]
MVFRPATMPNLRVPHGEVTARLWLLLPLRLYVGFYFVVASLGKVGEKGGMLLSHPERLGENLIASVDKAGYPYAFYRTFVHGVVEPYIWVFAFLVVFGELMTGLALITGTLTRLACMGGIFMMLNFFLAFDSPLAMPHNTTSFAAIMLVLMLTGAGRTYGTDYFLRNRLPRWMV